MVADRGGEGAQDCSRRAGRVSDVVGDRLVEAPLRGGNRPATSPSMVAIRSRRESMLSTLAATAASASVSVGAGRAGRLACGETSWSGEKPGAASGEGCLLRCLFGVLFLLLGILMGNCPNGSKSQARVLNAV